MSYLHPTTFEYLKPTDAQVATMNACREAAKQYASVIEALVPGGKNKEMVLNMVRDAQMWANVAITRHADGSPRE